MAFTRPSLTTIIDRIKGDFKSGLSLTTILRRSFIDVMAKAYGGAIHTLFGFIDFAKDQLLPDTAVDEFLLRWANIYGIDRLDATFTKLNIDVTGTTGGTLTVGSLYQRSDGVQYEVETEVAIPAVSTVLAVVVALVAGDSGNLDDGSTLTLTSPIAGIESDALVSSTAVEGEDQETIDALRTRLIFRIQFPPSGGTITDYIGFAKTVAGVTRVWVIPDHLGEGTVGLFFVEDDEDPIIPSPAKVDEVQTAVLPLKPISADLFTIAPSESKMDPTIALKPNTTAVQTAVTAELEDMLFREAQVNGASIPDQVGVGGTYDGIISLSLINEAISIAQGEEDHVLTLPTNNVEPLVGGIVTLGTIIFTTLV